MFSIQKAEAGTSTHGLTTWSFCLRGPFFTCSLVCEGAVSCLLWGRQDPLCESEAGALACFAKSNSVLLSQGHGLMMRNGRTKPGE